MRIVLLESAERRLPFVRDLVSALADEVVFADLDDVSSLAGEVTLVVVARRDWSDDDTALCARASAVGTHAPLLVITGPAHASARIAALRAGADEMMSIPFDVAELEARVFALVRLSSRGGVRRAGGFAIDAVRRRVSVAGEPVPLTLREYDVFAALVAEEGVVVSRSELASRLPEPASRRDPRAGDSNSVDVLVSRIRRKLGPFAHVIETVRGEGYRFRPLLPEG